MSLHSYLAADGTALAGDDDRFAGRLPAVCGFLFLQLLSGVVVNNAGVGKKLHTYLQIAEKANKTDIKQLRDNNVRMCEQPQQK